MDVARSVADLFYWRKVHPKRMAPPNSGQCGSVIFKRATVNDIFAGTAKDGSNNWVAADLFVRSNAGITIKSNAAGTNGATDNIYLDGTTFTKSGLLGTTSDAPNLTLSTASGDVYVNPATGGLKSASALTLSTDAGGFALNTASKSFATDSTIVSSHATTVLTSSGVTTRIRSDANHNIQLSPGLTGKVIIDSDLDSGTGVVTAPTADLALSSTSGDVNVTAGSGKKINFLSDVYFATGGLSTGGGSGGLTFSTSSGPINLQPATTLNVSAPIITTDGHITGDSVNLVLGTSTSGDVLLAPASGGVVSTDAQFVTSQGTIRGSTGLTLTTGAGDLALQPVSGHDVTTNAPIVTSAGSIRGSTGLSLTTGSGALALSPASGQSVTTTAKFVTSDGRIESSAGSGLSIATDSGDLTLSPADRLVFTKPVLTTDGHFTSASNTNFTITPGAGASVVIEGDLLVTGTLSHVNTTELNVEDKRITLGVGTNDDALVDGSGILLAGDDYATDAERLSILWKAASGSNNAVWEFSGGDLSITRTTTSNGTIKYLFSIDDTTTDLSIIKFTDSGSGFDAGQFIADFAA